MLLVFSSVIVLLVAALNLITESSILRHAQKDWPGLGDNFKLLGIVLIVLAVTSFGVGCWFFFFPNALINNPSLYLSLAMTLVLPGTLITIKGVRLKENQPERLGRHLYLWVIVMVIIALGLLIWTLLNSPINLEIPANPG